MEVDLSLTITAIIALSAIISPIITCIINNCHQSNLKRIEFYELQKRQALENYISASLKLSNDHNNDNLKTDFLISLNNLYLYFPNMSKISYDDLTKSCRICEPESCSYYSQDTIRVLSEQIKKK